MTVPRLLRVLVALFVSLSLVGAGSALAAHKPKPTVLGPNLVANPSVEQSMSDEATTNGIPVLPVGWRFEGATVLFDYNQRIGRTGTRSLAISGALAPGRQICDASAAEVTKAFTCTPNPLYAQTKQVNEQSEKVHSLRPFWLNEKALAVKAGKTYRFSMWSFRSTLGLDAPMGEGTASKVRWLDAAGKALSVVDGSQALRGAKREIGFKLTSADVVAPAGAAGAQVLLGHSDYTVTSMQVVFDDISFQEIIRK